jgi:antitoxin component of MazEF toxin-antitoxin module
MAQCTTTTRKWGNSLGIILPKDVVETEHIKENQTIDIIVIKKTKALKQTFGMLKDWKKSAQTIKDETRKELYDE